MSSAYRLKTDQEADRLEEQSRNGNYSLKKEFQLSEVKIQQNDLILDAGCGTGLLSRALIDLYPETIFNIHAIDFTDELLNFAKTENVKNCKYQNQIEFQKKDICKLEVKDTYNQIFSRFVFQHIPSKSEQREAAQALYQALAPGGTLYVIDSYGFFSHLDSSNSWLMEQLKKVEHMIPIDMNIGIKLRGIFLDNGVSPEQIRCFSENFSFESPSERASEANLWKQRFSHAHQLLSQVLGEATANRFSKEYVQEIMNPRTYIFAQKFIIKVSK